MKETVFLIPLLHSLMDKEQCLPSAMAGGERGNNNQDLQDTSEPLQLALANDTEKP